MRDILYRILSCCDRRANARLKPQHPDTDPPPKFHFDRLGSEIENDAGDNNRKLSPGRRHRIKGFASEPYKVPSEQVSSDKRILDIELGRHQDEKVLYRRLLLDHQGDLNAVSDEVARLLGIPFMAYNGPPVRLPNGSLANPQGRIEVEWSIYKGSNHYRTEVLVIENNSFDMVLGASSIRDHGLWEQTAVSS
ncbi:hypothetical protein ASPVEDRAFT_35181 [Aspergillus versicolor CBS 583.65]|uniref:HD-GYP domain-containing protein n=1 Tax=Aspergillus versicolor CBS 583.65 TaxID=1036611 RepID=A0A1L9P382_ASPVE|nr:uncharacterized protein ASPVEDRAFT_35181 [Aspergillus versicolor CBS 583.65]OJI95873.1 hypothetical protein ASPVEDRAFT_35181 [Aspergillus versicolor CBS 583.65]